MAKKATMVWIDLEMTGLDVMVDKIIQIATIVTDTDLNIIAEGPDIVINESEDQIGQMDEWNIKHHSESGLLKKVRESIINVNEAEDETIQFIKKYIEPKKGVLCGNSIAQDKIFMVHYMPRLIDVLHYRVIDVSSFKEVIRKWYPKQFNPPIKSKKHLAMQDIKESIIELKYYRENFINPSHGQ